jgi:hypothetical protein
MNGRVYDYNIGRFLSVDPFIHGSGNSQGINPYSYILNNPMAGTDPSGYAPCSDMLQKNCGEVSFDQIMADNQHSVNFGKEGLGIGTSSIDMSKSKNANGSVEFVHMTLNSQENNKSPETIGSPSWVAKQTLSTSGSDAQKSLIVGITGGGGHKSGAGPDLLNLAKQYEDDDGVDVQTFEWDDSKAARKAIVNFRKDNPEGRVVLMGYSLGGRAAVNIANKLGKKDISIDSLVTFDAYSFVGSSHKLRYNNVKQALNFYQQNPTDRSWGISPAGASNPYPGSVINSKHIKVINHNYTNDSRGINHINIIDYAIRDYGGQINDYIK